MLSLFSLADNSSIKLLNYNVSTSHVRIGEDLKFTVSLHNKHDEPLVVRLEYGIY